MLHDLIYILKRKLLYGNWILKVSISEKANAIVQAINDHGSSRRREILTDSVSSVGAIITNLQ